MGTSLCGMTSDCVATTVGTAAAEGCAVGDEVGGAEAGGKLGTVIINLQQTKEDGMAALRIFATIDDVMEAVRKRLRVRLTRKTLAQAEWVK